MVNNIKSQKEKAEDLVNKYRMILMSEDTDCGNEIFCTLIAKECSLIAVNEIQNTKAVYVNDVEYDYWEQVKQEIENL